MTRSLFIAFLKPQNSIEVCTNIDMVIWIYAALKLEEVKSNIVFVVILCPIFFELGCEYGIPNES